MKTKIFNFLARKGNGEDANEKIRNFEMERDEHEKQISYFIEYLADEGHTFLNMNSVAYGRFEETNRVRTIIVYIENPTRKVLVEKTKND
jgi:hypothetical protein